MNDAGLDHGVWKHSGDRLREALEAINDSDQDVADSTGLELVHHPQPELRALRLLDPEPQDLLVAGAGDADGEIDGLVPDQALVANLDPERVEVNDRIDRLERPVLPGPATSSSTASVTADTSAGETSIP